MAYFAMMVAPSRMTKMDLLDSYDQLSSVEAKDVDMSIF